MTITSGPAFVAPPATLSLPAYTLTSLPGLFLSDPTADALNAAGQGRNETLELTLSAASGLLFLPSLSPLSGIQAVGIGTPQLILTFTADQLAAVNNVLAGLQYAGPAAISGLAYAMRNISGPLDAASTNGNIQLDISGPQPPLATVTSGPDTVILSTASLAPTTTLTISGITGDLGGITGAGAVLIEPDAALEAPYNTISLSGTSLDFGTLSAKSLNESGAFIIAQNASFSGPVNLGTTGFIDFSGALINGGNAQSLSTPGLSLAAGALLTGSGALVAGNFSESGDISGPGTILVAGSETLVLDAGSISATHLTIAPGGVLELGDLDPLFGVFNPTPLTVASSVTLAFQGGSGAAPITGGLADTLAQSGGVIVIDSPDIFAGRVVNFAPGDRLVFPTLSGLTLLSITSDSFVVAGNDSNNVTQSYSFNTNYAAGSQLYVSTDAAGDSAVGLRDATTDVFLDGVPASTAIITAAQGVAQPIQGLDVLLRSWTTQSLTLTLSVANGELSDGAAFSPQLTISEASPAVLDAALAELLYAGNSSAVTDHLSITGSSGLLSGLSASIPIILNAPGVTIGGFGDAGQIALFAGNGITSPLINAAAPGEILVTGTADFANLLIVDGISGTALSIAAHGLGIFDAGADVSLNADASVNGQLDILTENFFETGNLTLASGGNADISGADYLTGSLLANGMLDLSSNLAADATSIGNTGVFNATGHAGANFGALKDAGQLNLFDQSSAIASSLMLSGTLVEGDEAKFAVQNAATLNGVLEIGPDATLTAATLTQTGGTISLSGVLSVASSFTLDAANVLNNGTIIAPELTFNSGASLTGSGLIESSTGPGMLTDSGGAITATGTLLLDDNATLINGASILIGTSASLNILGAISGGGMSFAGGAAELTINNAAQFNAIVSNMLDTDAIDLIGIAPSLVSFANGSISINGEASFALNIAASQPAVQIISDNHNGALITLGGDMPCFARGTRLLTPNGYRPVETFAPGDPVITLQGAKRAVRWIGRRTLDLGRATNAHPIRFAAHALGAALPMRPVYLSPLHAVFYAGRLVPALHLVNGATITNTARVAVTYYHIELDRHDVVLADGLPAETYLDTDNRGQLYQEQGRRGHNRTPFAPLVTTGPQLAAIRRTLHQIALQAGYTLTYHASLRGVAGRSTVLPEMKHRAGRRAARFALPKNTNKLALFSRNATPADTDPDSEDRRTLGICLHALTAGRRKLPLDSYLGQGWHGRACGDAGLWMGPGAEILLSEDITDITLSLAAIIQSWEPPAIDLPRAPP